MGVTLERVQNKFACIIGELCNEPAVLSQFAVWVDLRIAEYKAKGAISLDCTGSTPDPNWLHGLKPPKPEQSMLCLDPMSAESSSRDVRHKGSSDSFRSQNVDNFEVVEIKEEASDIFPTLMLSNERLNEGAFSRKRSASDIENQDFLNSDNSIFSSPSKSRRLSTCTADGNTRTESQDNVSNQSLMSVIGIGEESAAPASSNSRHFHTSTAHTDYGYPAGNNTDNPDDDLVHLDTSVDLTGPDMGKREVKQNMESPSFLSHLTVPGQTGSSHYLNEALSELSKHVKEELSSEYRVRWSNRMSMVKPMSTHKNTVSAVRTLKTFLLKKHDTREVFDIPPNVLDSYLVEFFTTIKQKNGSEYHPNSLRNLRKFLDFHLKENGYPYTMTSSVEFANCQKAFKLKCNELSFMISKTS